MPEEQEAQRPQGGNQRVKQAIALIAFAALAYWDTILWVEAQQSIYQRFGEGGWGAWLSQGWNLAFVAAIALEGVVAAVMCWGLFLAQVGPPTEEEVDAANLFIFILITIGALLSELFLAGSSIPFGLPGWVFAILVILMSLAIIYGTWIWLWTSLWIFARRKICSVVVPVIAGFVVYLFDSFLICIDWVVERYKECANWGTKTTRQCGQWAQQSYTSCSSWGTTTTSVCQSWLPGWLGWICLGWNVIVQTVCVAWVVVVELVCVAFFIVVELVCLAFIIVAVLVCLAWAVVVVVVAIVLMIVIALLKIVFFC